LAQFAKFFGIDAESQKRRREERAVKEIVDDAFKGLGFFGRIWAGLVKQFAIQILGTHYIAMKL
jgi:hypothetical protein